MAKPIIINIGFTSDEAEVINKEIVEGIRKLRKESGLSDEVISAIEQKENKNAE